MSAFSLSNRRPFRLVADKNGAHRFGGPAACGGVVPQGTDVPVQHVISLDLSDPLIPIENELGASKLPLFYPFKYGCGGPAMQYAVRSDSEIEILYLSDATPDDKDEQYVQVDELPAAKMSLEPLTYEQARILGFMTADEHFEPNDEDRDILDQLDEKNLVQVGGYHPWIPNAPDIFCHNPKCEFSERRVYFDAVVLMPPLPIDGDDEFWYEFQGAYMTFCYGLCRYCGTVIVFNVAT